MFGSFWLLESISFGFMSPQRMPGLLLFTLLALSFLHPCVLCHPKPKAFVLTKSGSLPK